MRALHALAVVLGTTVAALSAQLSGQEFARWLVWMQAEQVGPDWDAMRHAQLLAAQHNAGQFKRQGGGAFRAQDFLRADPWGEAAALTPEQVLEQQQREYEATLAMSEAAYG